MGFQSSSAARKTSPALPGYKALGNIPCAKETGINQRLKVAERMLGVAKILPNTRLGSILAVKIAREKDLSGIMRNVLTFDRYPATSEVIGKIVEKIEALSEAEVFAEAQRIIDDLYYEKIEKHGKTPLKTDFPRKLTVKEFSRLLPNGHFDPYQYFLSESWGSLERVLDYGKTIGDDKASIVFIKNKTKFKDAFVDRKSVV